MTTMDMYLSHWDGCVSLSPFPLYEHFFERLGRMDLTITGRTITVVRGDRSLRGVVPRPLEPSRNAGLGLQYSWSVDLPWANWIRHRVDMDIGDDDALSVDIPLDHELPWPEVMKCPPEKRQRIAEREFRIRAMSAFDARQDRVLRDALIKVPDAFRRLIPSGLWRSIIDEVHQPRQENTHARDVGLGDTRHAA